MSAVPAGARVDRSDFDAALVAGFRQATREAYRELRQRAEDDMAATLDAGGRFLPAFERLRDCPSCGAPSAAARPFMEKLGMRIVACRDCGMVYSANVLEPGYDHNRYVRSKAQPSFEALKRNEAYAALERVKCRYIVQRLADVHPRVGRFLEIGPGAGRLLDAAREAGWATAGLELNPAFARSARERGHDVNEGNFPRDAGDGPYDAIALLDVLEHLHAPREALEACAARLAPGGVVVVQVPNVDSLLVRAEGPASLNFCHGHWNHFSARTLADLGERAGLRTVASETIISELDRIGALPAEAVHAASLEACGEAPPAALTADWLHARMMGYKVLSFFARTA